MSLISETYQKCRRKKHGAGGSSRRMSLAIALSAWFIANKRCAWFFRWYYFKAPAWIKCAQSDLPARASSAPVAEGE
jgi:hypothetical protein